MTANQDGRRLQSSRPVAPAKATKPGAARAKQSVSAASIFKRPAVTKKKAEVTPNPTTRVPQLTFNLSSPQKPRSSSQSPQKEGAGAQKKKRTSDVHPLAAAFKEGANGYRTELYNRATAKLDTTFNDLITSLHNCNLAAISSPSNASDAKASPIKLTLPAKYDRATKKLFQPIGEYTITSHVTDANGEREIATLEEKLVAFQERYLDDVAEIKKLESRWETVIGEIWKVGVVCLGEDAMSDLLLTSLVPSSPVRDVEEESTLFVPSEGDPPFAVTKDHKKRVTFQTPQPELPKFLSGPSIFEDYPIPSLPELSEKEAEELEAVVAKLGTEQVEELKMIDKEQQKWWNKKSQQIALTLRDD